MKAEEIEEIQAELKAEIKPVKKSKAVENSQQMEAD